MTTVEFGSKRTSDRSLPPAVIENRYIRYRLTMRLSDAGLDQRQTKALYPNHRPPSSAHRSCAPRSLEPIVRWHPTKLRPSSPTSLTDPLPITASPELSPAASSNNQTRRRPTKEQSVGTRRFKSPRSHSSSLRRPIPTTPFLQMSSNDEVERPRDDLGRAADIVVADTLDIVRMALWASRTARTDC